MKRFIQGFIAGVCFVLLLLVLFVNMAPLMFRVTKLGQGYNKLECGMSQTEVVALMGTEGTKSTELPLGDGYLNSRYKWNTA